MNYKSDNPVKVPLTPTFFLNRNKTLFDFDHFGKKISAIGLFLNFLLFLKFVKLLPLWSMAAN